MLKRGSVTIKGWPRRATPTSETVLPLSAYKQRQSDNLYPGEGESPDETAKVFDYRHARLVCSNVLPGRYRYNERERVQDKERHVYKRRRAYPLSRMCPVPSARRSRA